MWRIFFAIGMGALQGRGVDVLSAVPRLHA
jgi:hypothetical protein